MSHPNSDFEIHPDSERHAAHRVVEFTQCHVPRVRPSLLYRLGIIAVAATMVLLPLVYAGLVIGLGAAIGAFAVHGLPETVSFVPWLVYAALLTAGITVVAFLVKPLFVGESRPTAMMELDAGEQARLEVLVADLCGIVRAPMPARIAVDCAVNASVTFRRGMFSLFKGDLILVVGLPLVRALDARAFAGVIAHELGHFAQGAGMRLTYVIRRMNGWFYRVVYQRDGWDRWLTRSAKTSRLGVIFQIAQIGIWCARRILFVLMLVGQAVSCFVLRRMEFDADHFEICVAGSDAFCATTERIALLHEAAAASAEVVDECLSRRTLPDDLPRLVSSLMSMTSSAVRAKISKRLTTAQGGMLDTHPSDSERIERAAAMGEIGIVKAGENREAELLFDELDDLSRRVTRHHFECGGKAGAVVQGDIQWVASEGVVEGELRSRKFQDAADRFVGCRMELWDGAIHPIPPALGRADDADELKHLLADLSKEMRSSASRCAATARKLAELDAEYATSLKGKELMSAGYSLDRQARTRVASGLALRDEMDQLRNELDCFQVVASRRLGIGLALKQIDYSRNLEAEDDQKLPAACALLVACDSALPAIVRLRELLLRQTILIQHVEPGADSPWEFRSRFQANAAHLRIALCDLMDALRQVADPVGDKDASIVQWLSPWESDQHSDDPAFRVFQQASEVLVRLGQRYREALGMAAMVLKTEDLADTGAAEP